MEMNEVCRRLDEIATNRIIPEADRTTIIAAKNTIQQQDERLRSGMTRRDAAIRLLVPDSGEAWLDAMIEKAVRREAAVKIMAGMCAAPSRHGSAYHAIKFADSIFLDLAREEEK